MNEDLEKRFREVRDIVFEREKREKVEKELKLLRTPIKKLLPDIFDGKRAIPNCFLRSALFGMVRKGRRTIVKDEPMFSMSQYQISFSGEHLDQNDLEVWDTLIYLAQQRNIGSELKITLYDLCQQMNLTYNQERGKKLIERALRLKFAMMTIKTGTKIFAGNLINNVYIDEAGDGKLVIEYNKKLAPLFIDNDYTFISVDIRHMLGDNQLAKWLYGFYESHKGPIPLSIDFIQKLCRSENSTKDFKYKMKRALEEIKKAYFNLDPKSKWDYEVTKNNFVVVYPKGKPQKTINFKNIIKTF